MIDKQWIQLNKQRTTGISDGAVFGGTWTGSVAELTSVELQWNFSGTSVEPQCSFSGTSVELQWNFSGTSVELQMGWSSVELGLRKTQIEVPRWFSYPCPRALFGSRFLSFGKSAEFRVAFFRVVKLSSQVSAHRRHRRHPGCRRRRAGRCRGAGGATC